MFYFKRNYNNEEHSAVEVKEEVAMHYKMKSSLETTLPNIIFIGPFQISVDHLRVFLINKKQEICGKLLDMFAARMKNYVEDVSKIVLFI